MTKGELEGKIYNWLKELNFHFNRLYDARSFGTRNAPSRPADFYLWLKPNFIYIEAKEPRGNILPFNDIRPSQYKAAKNSLKFGYKYVFIIQIKGALIGLKWKLLESFIKVNYPKNKSISYKELTNIGCSVNSKPDFKAFLIGL